MDVLVSFALLANLADVADQFGGRKKCECKRPDLKQKQPKQYMKIGYSDGERYWCEECPDIPLEAVYLANSRCRVKGCNGHTVWALNGTRDDGLCGPHHKKLPVEEQTLYCDVISKRCERDRCENRAYNAIVPEGKTRETTRPTHCGPCVKAFPEEEREKYVDVSHKRCERDGCGNFAINAIVPEGKTRETTRPTHCGPCMKALLPEEERKKYENVVSKRCECDGCEKFASYAKDFKGFPAKFCAPHAPTHFVHTSHKLCRGPRDGIGCPRDNTIEKNKSGGQCAWCDKNSNARRYELAVLDRLAVKYDFEGQYKIYDAVNVADRKRSTHLHAIDGVILFDAIVVAIEVDELGGHHQEEADECRERICEEYLKEEHGVDVAWIRIVPNIMGGKKVLGDEKDQFGEKAVAIREKIVDLAAAQIEKLRANPESDVFRFDQKSL
jgi:hypothetical protein